MCDKVSYSTYDIAKRYLGIINNRNNAVKGKKLERVYKCEICEKFHLTSNVKNRKNKREQ